MKITLNFERTISTDVSIMVDLLRASTTITMALDKFKEIIPTLTTEQAKKIAIKTGGLLAGERNGATLEGFDIGNSPIDIASYNVNSKLGTDKLILTTSNGTRILEDMDSKVLVGCFANCKSVAKAALKLANNHIDVVMAGVNGNFAIEDFLASGDILYWLQEYKDVYNIDNVEISEYAQGAILAISDDNLVNEAILNSSSAKRLTDIGFKKDVDFCINRNISNNVAIYDNGALKLFK
ncbi:putative 2-phosphosulfolactate phosphatase [Methanobrevibacter cuticularis]|uniref:2-phosphosulfolactate phosphatase n=1 Tax=Methanobrevibacter cuticularis TaxID=47311 RepID=A0A166FHU9_9EURY|nr:2-phosphosulfolactate phosphatase [Methanobrevibacter cuticularis]KZX17689.1 putative 2-phosphosulfolactate phosphatase [Methanobrevibacter cuticularis]